MIVSDLKQIDAGMEWADICWFEWCDELMAYGSRSHLARQKKIICRLHSYEAFSGYTREVEWANADKVIFVAEHIRQYVLSENEDLDIARTIVIPNGIDTDKFTFRKRDKGFKIAYVGYINYKKGPMLLLHTFKAIHDRDSRYKLYIAGKYQDPRYELYFNQMTEEMGLKGDVIFDGWQDDINKWLEDKNFILCTSVLESQNLSVMQAMSKGIRPVVHNFVGARSIYPDRYVWNTIDEAVKMVVSDGYDSEEYHNFVRDNYSLHRQLRNIRSAIDELLSYKKIVRKINKAISGEIKPDELPCDDVTVLTPCYNRARTLKEDLDKGLKLGSRPKVIIDNKSVEESDWLDLIEENKEIYNARIIRNEKNEGPGQARRIGLEYVDTGLTAFVDDDDMLLCLEKDKALADIGKLSDNAVLVIPRYVLNYDGNRISVGYDRQCFDGSASSEVLRIISSTGEIMVLLTGGAIGLTNELRKHSDVKNFTVSEDFVLLSRLLSANPVKEVRVTESIAHVRRISGTSLSKSITRQKLALTLIAQAVGCYYCLRDGIAGKDEVLEWMKERAALLQKLYDFGNDFETELIAYLTGEISEGVFVHYIELNGIGIENTLDELAPELKKMRGFFYTEKAKSVLPGKTDRHPLVSVIIPTFNRKDMLKRAVDCALKQDYPNIEVIISDNCSDDGTFEMVRENYGNEKRVIYHRNEKNLGPTMNYNVAFYGLARGEYCMTQSDDDYLIDSGYISKAARMLYENKDLSFVFGGYYYNHEEKNSIYRVKPAYRSYIDGRDFFINFLTQKYPYMPNLCTTLFRRETACAMEILQCDPDCLSADLSILLRLLLGGGAGFIDDIVLVYTLHKRSISRNPGTCVTGGDNDYIGKALTAAKADIGEMKKIRRLAQDVYGFTDEELDTWMIYRVFKYMYWRLNETAGTKREADVLLEYIRQEYPMLMNVLGETVLNRFGE
jgi:glycosyltransferase involved in cell wall biosynthesis